MFLRRLWEGPCFLTFWWLQTLLGLGLHYSHLGCPSSRRLSFCRHLSCFSFGCLSLDLGSTWTIPRMISLRSLISYVCKDSFSKEGHIHRFWNIWFWRNPYLWVPPFTVQPSLPLPATLSHHFIQSHRMARPLCFWNS